MNLIERKRPVLDDGLERAPLDVLHAEKRPALVLGDRMDGDDIRVAEGGGRPGLADKPRLHCVVRHVLLSQELDRHAPAELLLVGEVDGAHPA